MRGANPCPQTKKSGKMTDEENLLFIIANDMLSPAELEKRTGMTGEKIHSLYKTVFDLGLYPRLRKKAAPYRLHKDNNNRFGSFGKRLRKLADTVEGKSIAELADEIGVSCSSLYKYMDDNAKPRRDTLDIIAKYFHVSSDWLLTGMNDD